MQFTIIQSNERLVLDLPMLKSFLRIRGDQDDEILTELTKIATQWLEERSDKTFLRQTLRVIHDNNSFDLPRSPVIKVLEVIYHKKTLTPQEYDLQTRGGRTRITVPFRWKSPELKVTYEAGFGDTPEDVPPVLRQALRGIVEYLYTNGQDVKALEDKTLPWILNQRQFRLG